VEIDIKYVGIETPSRVPKLLLTAQPFLI